MSWGQRWTRALGRRSKDARSSCDWMNAFSLPTGLHTCPDLRCSPECLAEKRVEQEEVVESIELRDDKPMTKQLRQAARSGKGSFLLLTFKEVFDNISAGKGWAGWGLCVAGRAECMQTNAGIPCPGACGSPLAHAPRAHTRTDPPPLRRTAPLHCARRRERPAGGVQRRLVLQGRGAYRILTACVCCVEWGEGGGA